MDRKSKLLIGIGIVGVASAAAIYILWKNYRQNCKQCQKIKNISPKVVFLVSNVDEWQLAYDTLMEDLSSLKVLGLDCEWVSNDQPQQDGMPGRQPVSLLQLASVSGVCVLVRLHLLPCIPDSLKQLLVDRSILKVGVACMDDARYLLRDYSLSCMGCVDLRHLVPRTIPSANTMQVGLRSLTKVVLGVDLDKTSSVRRSDWEAEVLTSQQVSYAACDALAAVLIFVAMLRTKTSTSEVDDYSCIAAKAKSLCQGITDLKYSGRTSDNHSSSERVVGSSECRDVRTSRAYVVRKKPLYHNCQLRSPDGQLLCTCDVKKAKWYIDKGLGEQVSDDPVTVQLLFEPSGRPVNEQNYYLYEKDNLCVVCGAGDSYIRKNVIPREYRKHFPALLKEHKSHDVLLMCVTCHQRSNLHDNELKRHLLAECRPNSAPLLDGHDKYVHDPLLTRVKSAAKALLSSTADRIPSARLYELRQIVRRFYGVEQIDSCLLQQAASIDTRLKREGFEEAGELVVRYAIEHGGLVAFERLWRQHFLDSMKPGFLPKGWSVDHSHDQLLCLERNVLRSVTDNSMSPDSVNSADL